MENYEFDGIDSRVHPVAEKRGMELKERRHAEFFDVIGSSLKIDTPEKFCTWTQGHLQHVFPHGMLICGIGLIDSKNTHIQQLLTCNFPDEYIQHLHKSGGMNSSPVFNQWIKTRRPVLFELTGHQTRTAWLENFKRHGLQNMAAHGQRDLNSPSTSYFSFSKIPGVLTPRHAVLLDMLIPHLHVALVNALKGVEKISRKSKTGVSGLTGREMEILQWLGSGKTNWEIAQVLHISEHTVKNHVQRILIKLKVNTRAQAVAKGLIAK